MENKKELHTFLSSDLSDWDSTFFERSTMIDSASITSGLHRNGLAEPGSYNPYRALLLAVLERAVRDLKPEAPHAERRDAIGWFERGFRNSPQKCKGITFTFVMEHLDLSQAQVNFLHKKLEEARAYEETIPRPAPNYKSLEEIEKDEQKEKRRRDKLEAKRETYRISSSALLARERLQKREADRAIQRESGTFGCSSRRAA